MKKLAAAALVTVLGASSTFAFDHLKSITEFEKTIQKGSFIVDFYATWCNPCKEMEQNLIKLDAKSRGIKIYKVNIEKSEALVAKYGTPQVPALLYIKDGKILDGYVGLKQMEELERDMKTYFQNPKS
ncbi:MAG TPA: thioredoxin [Campylobacterales bacterium]|nr:thioredoxin [Campylobacterales bacterium]